MKPLIVGESNPYGGDDYYALYPLPEGCSGHRLCCLILGMRRTDYLDVFDRCNLVQGKWSLKAAKIRAEQLIDGGLSGGNEEQPIIILGSKVAAAFSLPFRPFEQFGEDLLVLPHPSGLCRLWHEPGAIERARVAVLKMAPELEPFIGKATALSSS